MWLFVAVLLICVWKLMSLTGFLGDERETSA